MSFLSLCPTCEEVELNIVPNVDCWDLSPNFEPKNFILIPCAVLSSEELTTTYFPFYGAVSGTPPTLNTLEEAKREFILAVIQRSIVLKNVMEVTRTPRMVTVPARNCRPETQEVKGESFSFKFQATREIDTNPLVTNGEETVNQDWQGGADLGAVATGYQLETFYFSLIKKYKKFVLAYVDCNCNLYIAHNYMAEVGLPFTDGGLLVADVKAMRIDAQGSVPDLLTTYQVDVTLNNGQFLTAAETRRWTNVAFLAQYSTDDEAALLRGMCADL